MKIIRCILSSLLGLLVVTGQGISATALATPSIGDQATYKMHLWRDQGADFTAVDQQTIIAFNDVINQYQLHHVSTTVGSTQVFDEWVNTNAFFTDVAIGDILSSCAQKGGSLTSLTVAAGTFDSCKIVLEPSDGTVDTYWFVANIPFGFAKSIELSSDKHSHIERELISYQFEK